MKTDDFFLLFQDFSRVMTRPTDRIRGFSKCRGSGRVGLGQEAWKSRGPGRVMTREIRVTRGSSHLDPRVVIG